MIMILILIMMMKTKTSTDDDHDDLLTEHFKGSRCPLIYFFLYLFPLQRRTGSADDDCDGDEAGTTAPFCSVNLLRMSPTALIDLNLFA